MHTSSKVPEKEVQISNGGPGSPSIRFRSEGLGFGSAEPAGGTDCLISRSSIRILAEEMEKRLGGNRYNTRFEVVFDAIRDS